MGIHVKVRAGSRINSSKVSEYGTASVRRGEGPVVHLLYAKVAHSEYKGGMRHFYIPFMALLAACSPKSEDDTLARCDRIADKKVRFFADQDNAGTLRQAFLSSCVLGPDKTYTEHGQTWVDCMDGAETGAELSNCQKEFDHAVKTDKIDEVRTAIETGMRAYLCDGATEDTVKEHEDKIEALRGEAKMLGAEESEIPTVSEVSAKIDKTTFCAK